MARRRANAKTIRELRTAPEPELVPAARLVPVDGRPFVTFGPSDPVWSSGEVRPLPERAFARLRPPAVADDFLVALVKRGLEQHGAVVKVEPRETAAAVVPSQVDVPETAESPRDVVMALVDASNSDAREELRSYCEEVMARCGL